MEGVKIISQTPLLTVGSAGVLFFLSIAFSLVLTFAYYKLGEKKKSFKPIVELFPPIVIWFASFIVGFLFFENVIPFNYEEQYKVSFVGSVNMDEFYKKYVVLDTDIENQTLTVMLKGE